MSPHQHPMLDQLTTVADYPVGFENKLVEWMLESVESEDDVDRYWLCDLFVKLVDERRKHMNSRLMGLTKAWAQRKKDLRKDTIKVIKNAAGKGKARTVAGGMGTVSTVSGSGLQVTIDDAAQAIDWLRSADGVLSRDMGITGCIETIEALSLTGKDWIKTEAERRHHTGEAPIPGVTVTPKEDTLTVKRKHGITNELVANLIETEIFGDHSDHVLLDDMPDFDGPVGEEIDE